MRSIRLLLIGAIVVAGRLPAQSARVVGSVQRDAANVPAPGVDIAIPALGRATTTDSGGAFRIDGLPAGRQVILIRHIGFAALEDTVDLVAGTTLRRDYLLVDRPQMMDSVRIVARAPTADSPMMRGFEQRRAQGMGRFITEAELRRHDTEHLSDLLLGVPGLRGVSDASGTYLSSTRATDSYASALESGLRSRSGAGAPTTLGSGFNLQGCWVAIYIDGVPFYDPATGRNLGSSPPDVSKIDAREFQAIEFYSGTATVPAQFRLVTSNCGTLVLWTRER